MIANGRTAQGDQIDEVELLGRSRVRHQGGRVGTEHEERDVAKVQQAGEPDDDAQPERQKDPDAGQ